MKKKKGVRELKKRAWKLFSIYIRLKYMDAETHTITCYTCEREMSFRNAQAGHAIGGRTNSVLFDEDIVRPQCYRCNVALGGNYPIFVTKLIEENGLKWWENKLRNSNKTKRFTVNELEKMIEEYTKKIKELENEKSIQVL